MSCTCASILVLAADVDVHLEDTTTRMRAVIAESYAKQGVERGMSAGANSSMQIPNRHYVRELKALGNL